MADHQASLSLGFSRQEYWSGLPFPSPGDLPDPGIEPMSPALQADALPSEPPGKFNIDIRHDKNWLELTSSKMVDYLALVDLGASVISDYGPMDCILLSSSVQGLF